MSAVERSDERPRRRLRVNAASVLFAAAALAFLLPFATVSCHGETVSFTGIELATRTIEADPAAAREPDKGLAGDVEDAEGTYALMALVFLVGGVVSVAARGRGGGFALAALLSLLVLLLDAADTEADIQIGYWLALASVCGAGVLLLWSSLRERRQRRRQDPPLAPQRGGRLRRRMPSLLFAAAAIAVVALLEALTTRDVTNGAGPAYVEFTTARFAVALDCGRLQRLAPPWVRSGDPRRSIAAVSEDGASVSPDGKSIVFAWELHGGYFSDPRRSRSSTSRPGTSGSSPGVGALCIRERVGRRLLDGGTR